MMSTTCTENTVDRFLPSGRGPNLLTLDLARENEIPLLLYLEGKKKGSHRFHEDGRAFLKFLSNSFCRELPYGTER